MKRRFGTPAIVLIILIAVAIVMLIVQAWNARGDASMMYAGLVWIAIYVAALVGLLMKKNWGAILTFIIAIMSAVGAIAVLSLLSLLKFAIDVVAIWLAVLVYKTGRAANSGK